MLIALVTSDVPYLTDLIDAAGGPLYATAALNAVVIVPLHDLLVDWNASKKYKAWASALLALVSGLVITLVSGVEITAPFVIAELTAALGAKELGYLVQSKMTNTKPTVLAPRVEGGLGRSPESYGLTEDPDKVAALTRDGVLFNGHTPAATGSMDIAQGD